MNFSELRQAFTMEIQNRITSTSGAFFFREIHVGNTIELTRMNARSTIFKCLSIANINFGITMKSLELNRTRFTISTVDIIIFWPYVIYFDKKNRFDKYVYWNNYILGSKKCFNFL